MTMATPPPLETDRIVFDSPLLRIGLFRCHPWQPFFEDTGPIQNHILVFPRTHARITHAGGEPMVTGPNDVMFYNRYQEYRRAKVSDVGDVCEWFAFRPDVLLETLRAHDPRVEERPDRPFSLARGPSDSRSYLLQRLVVEHVTREAAPDPLYVEETLVRVLHRVAASAYRPPRGAALRAGTQRSHGELVEATRALLATRAEERLSLTEVARAVYSSPYHLARIFRARTGFSLHAYLTQARLRVSLARVTEPDSDLTSVGLDAGFSSHSHFTQAFRQVFGATPSEVRVGATSRRLREMSRNLTATEAPGLRPSHA
ncbi:helix-turn-helix transcriptional regulator [Pyxidicoccus sp. 3LG]